MNAVDQPDFETLITQHKGVIYKVANSYCKDADDRKDLVQEIILQLWRSFPSFNNSVKVSTWMFRVALNVAITFYRRDSKRRNVTTELSDSLIEIIADEESDETESHLHKLQQFISELKELDRALMILYLEEKSQREIAEILGLRESNVSTKVNRIKQKLRERFSITN